MGKTRLWLLVAISSLAMVLTPGAFAGKGGNKGGKGRGGTAQGDLPVCGTFRDGTSDQVRSDGFGGGLPYCQGTNGIQAVIGGNLGVFKLDTSKSFRTVVVAFPGCSGLIGGDCSTDVNMQTMNEEGQTGGGLISTGTKLDLRTIAVGTSALADFQIAFPSDLSKSTPNLIIFGGSNLGLNACGDPLPVAHTATDTWTIEASAQTACLFEVVAKNGKRERTGSSFTLPFKITITLQ